MEMLGLGLVGLPTTTTLVMTSAVAPVSTSEMTKKLMIQSKNSSKELNKGKKLQNKRDGEAEEAV